MGERSLLTSVHNPAVQRARELGGQAKRRRELGLCLVEGVKLIGEALAAGVELVEALVSPRLAEDQAGSALLTRLEAAAVRLNWASDRVLAAAADTETHQGVVAIARRRPCRLEELLEPEGPALLVLAAFLQEPGNVGALVRVAEAFGASGLVALGGADPWGPKAVRASASSIFRLRVAVEDQPLEVARGLRERGVALVAAVAHGGEAPGPALGTRPLAIILGSEGGGVEPSLAGVAGSRVTIRLARPVESLNVVSAAAVLLHEATRER